MLRASEGKNGITVLESLFLNAVTSSEYVNVGQESIILEVWECDSGQFVPCEGFFFLWKLGKLNHSLFFVFPHTCPAGNPVKKVTYFQCHIPALIKLGMISPFQRLMV